MREVCYPWHPWCGKAVYVHGKTSRLGRVFLRCGLEAALHGKSLEIPAWMLDRSVCCLMQPRESPGVDVGGLRALKRVLLDATTGQQAVVTQSQHRSLHKKGHADAKVTTASRAATASISESGKEAGLAEPARSDQAIRHGAAGANAHPTSQRAWAGSGREGGDR